MSSLESAQPTPDEASLLPRLTSIPVDPLASHIATMIRRLDDEVRQLRAEAEAEAERVINEAHGKAAAIIERAAEQAKEAEKRRDAMLEQRARVIRELRTIRDTVVGLAGRFEQERPDIGPRKRSTAGNGQLPPPPRRGVHEDQQTLFSDADAIGTGETKPAERRDPSSGE